MIGLLNLELPWDGTWVAEFARVCTGAVLVQICPLSFSIIVFSVLMS